MDVMESSAIAIVPMCSSVRANSTAVPAIVATASESKNQEQRKMTVCWRLMARRSVRQNERSENDVKNNKVRNLDGVVDRAFF
jgi:hypothetical protein